MNQPFNRGYLRRPPANRLLREPGGEEGADEVEGEPFAADLAGEAGDVRVVVLDGSVVMDDTVVGADAVVRGSVLGTGARVGAGCRLENAVVGDGAEIGERNELLAGARVWLEVALPAGAVRFSSDA